ncbi:MAG TPA: sigma-70 family RNA polymerase sigma factor [Steroidobacteraceae bacterium]
MASNTAGQPPDAAASEQRDGDIILHIHSGNLTQAFELVMERYEAKVYRLCLAYVRIPAQAQDTAQDSLIRLWRALPKYDGRAALSTWIYAITRNGCLTFLSKRRAPVSLNEAGVEAEVASIGTADVQESQDQSHTIRQLVAELPETTRRIVTLYYFEEQSVAEVSELVGLPEGTVKTHLFRARSRLLARLEALGLADPAHWNATGTQHG